MWRAFIIAGTDSMICRSENMHNDPVEAWKEAVEMASGQGCTPAIELVE